MDKSNLKQFNIRQQHKPCNKFRCMNTFARHCMYVVWSFSHGIMCENTFLVIRIRRWTAYCLKSPVIKSTGFLISLDFVSLQYLLIQLEMFKHSSYTDSICDYSRDLWTSDHQECVLESCDNETGLQNTSFHKWLGQNPSINIILCPMNSLDGLFDDNLYVFRFAFKKIMHC